MRLVHFFKQAFPHIPLTVLRKATVWRAVGGWRDDEWYEALMRPYWPAPTEP